MCRQPVWPGLCPAFPKLRIAHGDETRDCSSYPFGEGSDFGAMRRKFGACIGVQRLPEKIEERGGAVAERVRQTEGMLDQLGGIQPDIAVRRFHQPDHLAEIAMIAPAIADLLGIGRREGGSVFDKVLGQLGLDPYHSSRARNQNVEVRGSSAAQTSRAFPLELELIEGRTAWHDQVANATTERRKAVHGKRR